jgi:hypothetical protein
LIPFFHFLLERQALAKSQGISWQVFYLRKEFLEDFTAILSRNWLKEASSVYHFVRKIEIGTRKFVDRPIISRMDSLFMEKGCDFYVLKFSETLSQLRVSHKIALPYPISKDKPFCVTREEFEVLAYTEYQRFIGYEAPGSQKSQTTDVKPNPEKAVVLPKKAKKRQARRDAFPLAALPPEEELVSAAVLADSQEGHCSKEGADHEEGLVAKPKDRSSDAVGGGAAALFPDSEGHLLEEGASFVASSDSFLCKLGRSLEKSASLLQSITIHPRVEAWYFSKEAGLEYYHFHSEPSTHHLSEAEMVRSHRFPEIFLSLIFNKNYSKEEKILRDNGTIHTHYRSVVIVDERKYILEATISEVGVLYHFYLKPIKKLIHYFEMTKDSIAEFPPISSLSASKSKALNTFDSSGVTFHRDGHLLTKYEGSNYKVLYLGQGKDPDLVS